MAQLSDYTLQVQQLVHDTAAIDYTQADMTGFINNARNRVAMDFHNVRYLFQNASLIAAQEQYPIFGGVVGLTIVSGGANYVTPVIAIPAPGGGGVQAAAQAVVANGVITQINMTNWGSGYTAIPSPITVTDVGGGSGAQLTALATVQIFDVNSVSVLWGTQRYTMGWLAFTPFQAFCRSNPTLRRQPAVWSTFDEINTLFVYPIPDQAYPVDLDMIGLPNPLVNTSDNDTQIRPPINDCVQFYAAYLALMKLQNFDQAEKYEKKYEARAKQVIQTKQDRRIPNIYRNQWRRINRW